MAQAQLAAAGLAAIIGGYTFYSMSAPTPIPPQNNRAFVFIKPHAVTPDVENLVRKELEGKGIKVLGEGELSSEKIDKDKLIDQHYYAIASKATMTKPENLNVPADKFQATFGQTWEDTLKAGKAFNALDACKELNVDGTKMAELWATCKKNKKLVKFGGGFYCGEIAHGGKKIFVFNGFFMEMRSAFTAPGKKIHWYDVEWDPKTLAWADFRGKVLGPTDPKEAPKESLRGQVLADWKKLGLKSEPNVGDNAVHASASPFEGLAERMNWLGAKCDKDAYCSAMKAAGLSEKMIQDWTVDPQVKIEGDKKKSLFDSLEDMDADVCLGRAKELASLQ